MRILQVDNWQWHRFGDLRVSTSRKLYHGLIRGNHKVLEFSDRDLARFEAVSYTHLTLPPIYSV